jgi:putative endonuclease
LFQIHPIVVPAKAGTHNHRYQTSWKRTPTMNTATACYVSILASRRHGTLYISVCSNPSYRLSQHRVGRGSQFVRKYGVSRLVYMETCASPREAIAREKQLKNWHRDWKIRLIEQDNPEWGDLSHLL